MPWPLLIIAGASAAAGFGMGRAAVVLRFAIGAWWAHP